jgi:hypothetical protein
MDWLNLLPPQISANEASDSFLEQIIRHYRNTQLAASDWTQLPDIETDKVDVAAWRVYRQELRDMMNKGVPPKEIVFPTPPI